MLQFLALTYFVLIAVACCGTRLRLPKTKFEPVLDVLLVVVVLIYAVVLKIIFST
ncbi:MAG: hypothetical protein J6B20_01405 [Clostridia bacterium]|nr:hypothetical protein [Clostridia bacterium]